MRGVFPGLVGLAPLHGERRHEPDREFQNPGFSAATAANARPGMDDALRRGDNGHPSGGRPDGPLIHPFPDNSFFARLRGPVAGQVMRAITGRFDPRWTLPLAAVALAGASTRAADPANAPAVQRIEVVDDRIQILVEKETDQVGDEGEVADEAAEEHSVPQVLERLRERALKVSPEAIGPAAQQRRAIAQRAGQLEQVFRPLLNLELALARQSCPGLEPDARRAVLAAGERAVKGVALTAATAMLGGRQQQFGQGARRLIHDAVAAALEDVASPEEFAGYEREAESRQTRREEAARLGIVRWLDEELHLTTGQRDAVLAALHANWQDDWMRMLDARRGKTIDGRLIAPDFAITCIEPHLTDEQKREWSAWCRAAGRHGVGTNESVLGNVLGLPQPDAWWTP